MKVLSNFFLMGLFTLLSLKGRTQNSEIKQGVIQFEKKIDIYSFIEDLTSDNDLGNLSEKYQRSNPQFEKQIFLLYFNNEKSLYQPKEEDASNDNEVIVFLKQMAGKNIVATDIPSHQSLSQKNVLEEKFLVKDSLRAIKWKLRDETRDIAGFHCRRADARIMDSTYVVAFFCMEIPVSAGPESFTGLPGMILGVALPDQHITWFATNVVAQPVDSHKLSPSFKGKTVNQMEYRELLEKSLKTNKYKGVILEKSLL